MTNDSASLSPQSEQANKGVVSTIFCDNFHNIETFKHFFGQASIFWVERCDRGPFQQGEGACSVGEILLIPLAVVLQCCSSADAG